MPPKNGHNAAYEVNNEIKNIYEYCLAAGLTHEEIVEKAKPYLQHPLQYDAWKKTFLTILKIGICCLALSFTLASDKISRSVLTHGRHFMFKVLAVWDWTDLYSETCLVNNPYYLDEQVYVVDCQACEDVFDVDYLNSTSSDEISQLYMQRNIPVIVRDAMSEWPVMKETFTISNLTEKFYDLEDDICMFQTNLPLGNHYKFFDKLLNQDLQRWYAHWENCDKSTQKLLRKFYSRPYFMPGVVQMTEANWILMSSGYSGKKFKEVDVMSSVTAMWVAQVWGYNKIQFQPKEPCNKMCNTLEDTIEEGEIVLFNPAIWTFSYLPGDKTENLAIAAGGFSHFS
ncbi:hypothetical protein JTE90_010745 [Oedothorax gibbosus]|uniref:Uncharacterized protein n=1 Tax=Oedothorax gibbosus TaxID=931172 RepID=A0AAV6UD31_9ARAC|nr:hypothetical protein JTE90_010745 [Oedothorax gibbosus]